MEYQSFNNSEDELLFFVKSFYNETWVWSPQYADNDESEGSDESDENRKANLNHQLSSIYSDKLSF